MTIPENVEVHETPVLSCWKAADGIVYVRSKSAERTIDNYRKVFEVYAKLSSNGAEKFCLLGDISETQPPPKEVRDYIAQEMAKHVKALAMVSVSAMGTATGSVFEMLAKNPFPMAMFADHGEALIWLRRHL